jgi:hypothetical protein
MADITNLAESIGLGTSLKDTNTMPFTRAATMAVSMNAAEKKAEKERLAYEKKLKDQILSRVKFDAKDLDNEAAQVVKGAYGDVILSGGDPEMVANYQIIKENEKNRSKATKMQYDMLQKNEILAKPIVKDALLKNNKAELEKLAVDPNNNLFKDESGRFYLNKQIPTIKFDEVFADQIKQIEMVNKTNWQPVKGGKQYRQGNVIFQEVMLPDAAFDLLIDNMFAQKGFGENFEIQYADDIKKEMANGLSEGMAMNKVIKDKFRPLTTALRPIPASTRGGGVRGNTTTNKVDLQVVSGSPYKFNFLSSTNALVAPRKLPLVTAMGTESPQVGKRIGIELTDKKLANGTPLIEIEYITQEGGTDEIKKGFLTINGVKDLLTNDEDLQMFNNAYNKKYGAKTPKPSNNLPLKPIKNSLIKPSVKPR